MTYFHKTQNGYLALFIIFQMFINHQINQCSKVFPIINVKSTTLYIQKFSFWGDR